MSVVEIGSVSAVAARVVDFSAFGVDWRAILLPEGNSISVIVRPAEGRTAMVATSVPLGSVEDEEDLAFVLSMPEVGFALREVADYESIDGFDDEAYAKAGLSFVVCHEVPGGKGVRVDYAGDDASGMMSDSEVFKGLGDLFGNVRVTEKE